MKHVTRGGRYAAGCALVVFVAGVGCSDAAGGGAGNSGGTGMSAGSAGLGAGGSSGMSGGAAGASSGGAGAGSGGASGADGGTTPNLVLAWPPARERRIALGTEYGCAIRSDSSVVCWGNPSFDEGQAQAPSGSFRHISATIGTTCGLRLDDTIQCWGSTDGDTQIPPAGAFSFMDTGVSTSCAIFPDSSVECWGADANTSRPPDDTYTELGIGRWFGCGLTTAQQLRCASAAADPAALPPSGSFAMLAAGNRHSCALRADRTLACWGVGDADDPSDGSDEYEESWGQAVPPEGEFWYVAVGSIHSCALRPNGEAVCWGAGKTAAACEGSIDACGMSVPPSGAFVALALGYTNTCGIRPDRSIECWGSNTGNRSTPPSGAL